MTQSVKLGDELEISFSLTFNKAAVARRPDKEAFEAICLVFTCKEKNKEMRDAAFTSPGIIGITKDNESVKFNVVIDNSRFENFFESGELWVVAAQYISKDGATLPSPPQPTTLFDMKIA